VREGFFTGTGGEDKGSDQIQYYCHSHTFTTTIQ